MPPSRIFLIGYRGTGKSTVGRHLAAALGWAFHDADEHIERAAEMTIADIFATEGEAGFRERESASLTELCRAERCIVATGGGVILRPANRELLQTSGFVAWLTATPETIWARLQTDPTTAARRPNLTASGGQEEIANLLALREPHYRATASATFPTEGRSPEQVAAAILAAWPSCSICR